MISDERLIELRKLAQPSKVSHEHLLPTLMSVRMGMRELLGEIERFQEMEAAVRRVVDDSSGSFPIFALALRRDILKEVDSFDPEECGYCSARGQEMERGDSVIDGRPRCVDAGACQDRIDQDSRQKAHHQV